MEAHDGAGAFLFGMKYDTDTLKERLQSYLSGDGSALSAYKYRASASVPLEPCFPEEVQKKVGKLIKDGETLQLSKNVLRLVPMPFSATYGEYTPFKRFKYDIAFTNTCRLMVINRITGKERLLCLTAVELAKKWKGARTEYKTKLNTPSSIISMAEILSNDVWSERNATMQSRRFYDATTLDSKSARALKYKYCRATIERIKKSFTEQYEKPFSDIQIRRWLDGQIVSHVVKYAIKQWGCMAKAEILDRIFSTFRIRINEDTLLRHAPLGTTLARKKTEKSSKQKNKEKERYSKIKKLIQRYGKQWRKKADTRDITWYKRHKDLFQNES